MDALESVLPAPVVPVLPPVSPSIAALFDFTVNNVTYLAVINTNTCLEVFIRPWNNHFILNLLESYTNQGFTVLIPHSWVSKTTLVGKLVLTKYPDISLRPGVISANSLSLYRNRFRSIVVTDVSPTISDRLNCDYLSRGYNNLLNSAVPGTETSKN